MPRVLDWVQMLGALRTGDPDAVAQAIAALEPDEADKTDSPPDSSFSESEAAEPDSGPDRVWQTSRTTGGRISRAAARFRLS